MVPARGEPLLYTDLPHALQLARGNCLRTSVTTNGLLAVEEVIVISTANELLLSCFHWQRERIPIDGNLEAIRRGALVAEYRRRDGRHSFCRGCTINCYMDPSFQYRLDGGFVASLRAKAKSAVDKYFRAR